MYEKMSLVHDVRLRYVQFKEFVKKKSDGKGHTVYYITIPNEVVKELKLQDKEIITVIIAKLEPITKQNTP